MGRKPGRGPQKTKTPNQGRTGTAEGPPLAAGRLARANSSNAPIWQIAAAKKAAAVKAKARAQLTSSKNTVEDRKADADAFLEAAIAIVGERATITHSSSFGLLEVSAHGVTKATGLAEFAAQRDIAADEVLAIGDMPNDVSMLRWAGRSYAVANAHPEVVAVADKVIGSNDEDAVAALIEHLLAS